MRIAGHAGGSGPAPWGDGGRCRPGAWSQPHLSRGATTTVSWGAHAATVIIPNSSRPSSVVVANGLVMGVFLSTFLTPFPTGRRTASLVRFAGLFQPARDL